ncbi:hypothetical protein PENTCL1PPCAC_28748, partial [Pristionchus entomophagus]
SMPQKGRGAVIASPIAYTSGTDVAYFSFTFKNPLSSSATLWFLSHLVSGSTPIPTPTQLAGSRVPSLRITSFTCPSPPPSRKSTRASV